MRLAWTTDIHLDFIARPEREEVAEKNLDTFCSLIKDARPEGIVITGDISLSPFLEYHLISLEKRLQVPIYFVLGNHDFWHGGIEETRKIATELSNASEFLKYMGSLSYISLTSSAIMVGHDGWYDALNGNLSADVMMNDWSHISDFSSVVSYRRGFPTVDINEVLSVSRKQAATAAAKVMNSINDGIHQKNPKDVIVLTHVPPFPELYRGHRAGQSAIPWYTSKMMGDALLSVAGAYPHINFEIFCGHMHKKADVRITENMICHVGEAEYGGPTVQGIIEVK